MLNFLPNFLTLFRFFLVYPIVISINENQFLLAIIFFILAGISDFFDGFLARKLEAISEFGMIADPIADKTLIIATLISLTIAGKVDLWIAYLVLGRDMIAVAGYILATILLSPYKVKTHFSVKVYTTFLFISMGTFKHQLGKTIRKLKMIFIIHINVFV